MDDIRCDRVNYLNNKKPDYLSGFCRFKRFCLSHCFARFCLRIGMSSSRNPYNRNLCTFLSYLINYVKIFPCKFTTSRAAHGFTLPSVPSRYEVCVQTPAPTFVVSLNVNRIDATRRETNVAICQLLVKRFFDPFGYYLCHTINLLSIRK